MVGKRGRVGRQGTRTFNRDYRRPYDGNNAGLSGTSTLLFSTQCVTWHISLDILTFIHRELEEFERRLDCFITLPYINPRNEYKNPLLYDAQNLRTENRTIVWGKQEI